MHCRQPPAFPPANAAEDARSSAPTLKQSVSSHGPAACATHEANSKHAVAHHSLAGESARSRKVCTALLGFKTCAVQVPQCRSNKHANTLQHTVRTAHKRHQIVQLDKTKIRHPICCMRIISATSCKLQKLNRNPAEIINLQGLLWSSAEINGLQKPCRHDARGIASQQPCLNQTAWHTAYPKDRKSYVNWRSPWHNHVENDPNKKQQKHSRQASPLSMSRPGQDLPPFLKL